MHCFRKFVPFVVLSVCLAVGCGGDKTGDEGDKGSSANKRFLKLGTAPIGGAFNTVGGALAEVINVHKAEGVGKFEAAATKGSQQNIRDLENGELDFALSNSAITYFAVRGEGVWEKEYGIRTVMTLAPNVAMFITLKSTGITKIADFKGKRISVGPSGAGFEHFVKPILEAHGVTYEDFEPLNATQSGAVDLLGDGAADAAFLGGAVPTASVVQACATQDVVFVPYSLEAVQALVDQYAFFDKATVTADKYSDLQEDFYGMNVGSMHLITSAGQDEELVYQVTKSIYENREEVVKKHPAGKAINPKVAVRNTGTEFHPGAIRFYKEIGIWPEADDADAAPAEGDAAKPSENAADDGNK